VANHKSAAKRARQDEKRRERNRGERSRVRSVVKGVREAADAGDAETARQRLHEAERTLRKAASKGVIPKQRASRKVSRLARRLNKLSQA